MENMKKYLKDIDEEKIARAFAIKKDYDEGKISLEEGRKMMKAEVVSLAPHEIAYMEQELKEFEEDECQKEDIQTMLAIFEDVMITKEEDLDEYHPIKSYRRENEELRKILLEIEDLVQYPVIKNQWIDIYDRLSDYKIHLSRKQNQLYSLLEKKGFDRPTTTMWTLDNFIRDEISEAYGLLNEDREDEFIAMQSTIVEDIRDLIDKEETVLYPTSLAMISADEFEEMKSGDDEIGYAWIKVEHELSEDKVNKSDNASELAKDMAKLLGKYGMMTDNSSELEVSMGKLTLDQINLIFKHLPVDISYVDENEIVKFYSDTAHRVFPRSKNVIGRDVKNCHPRGSVHIVEEIIEKFRSGEKDNAEFWINKPGLFIYIYYVAVRDEDGKFRGVLEMMQDCTHIRSLEDSRTLLTWSNEGEEVVEENSNQENQVDTDGENNVDIVEIGPETKLKDLLNIYPELKDELPRINEKFKMLHTPLARVMIPKANIKIMAERGDMEVQNLIDEINEFIRRKK
ncbi:MAG: PAS domain-containing protein [Tissierellia bacterium]|nr:PAS domain-containing protein [Tissierellia bacterium]